MLRCSLCCVCVALSCKSQSESCAGGDGATCGLGRLLPAVVGLGAGLAFSAAARLARRAFLTRGAQKLSRSDHAALLVPRLPASFFIAVACVGVGRPAVRIVTLGY
jgi:hypothetical protein